MNIAHCFWQFFQANSPAGSCWVALCSFTPIKTLSRWSFGCRLSQYLLQLVPTWENKTANKHKKTRKHSVKIFPQTSGLGTVAVRHRFAQVFVFIHCLVCPQLEVKSMWFSLRCSESSLSTAGSLGKAGVCHQAPGCAAGVRRGSLLFSSVARESAMTCESELLVSDWLQRAAQKPGHSQVKKWMHFILFFFFFLFCPPSPRSPRWGRHEKTWTNWLGMVLHPTVASSTKTS